MWVSQLLGQRKATKKRLKEEKNEFKKKVLDGLQIIIQISSQLSLWSDGC